LGEAEVLVGRTERGVVARVGERVGHDVVVERACIGEALALVRDHPDAHALGLRGGEGLDLALVHLDLGVEAAHDHGLDLLTRASHADHAVGDVQQLGHAGPGYAAVPPTVSFLTRRVGTPSPTGTPCPSLPHVPGGPIAKSVPSASMLVSTSGPLPMRLPS